MSYLNNDEFKVLSIFADNVVHPRWEFIGMGVILIKTNDSKFWKWFKRKFLENNWIRLEERHYDGNDALDTFKLTGKGDSLIREECIIRGSRRDKDFYRTFDRTVKPAKPRIIQTGNYGRR